MKKQLPIPKEVQAVEYFLILLIILIMGILAK